MKAKISKQNIGFILILFVIQIVIWGAFTSLVYFHLLRGLGLFAAVAFAVAATAADALICTFGAVKPVREASEREMQDFQTQMLQTMDSLSKGQITNLAVKADTPIGKGVQHFLTVLHGIVTETTRLMNEANTGDLTQRIDESKYQGNWKAYVAIFNRLMETVSAPITELNQVLQHMSVDDFSIKMEGHYEGVFQEMSKAVNTTSMRLVGIQALMEKIARGDVQQLSTGANIRPRSANDKLMPALADMMSTVNALVAEMGRLTEESVNGKILHARGNVEQFQGGYREIVEGVNHTLDAISVPILEIMQVLEAIRLNDYTVELSHDFKGDFVQLAEAIQNVDKQGLYIQEVLEQVAAGDISELNDLKEKGALCENDRLTPALISMMDMLHLLIDQLSDITSAASKGNLGVRGDVEKFHGKYAEIVEGLNRLVSEVELPAQEVTMAMAQLASCEFKHRAQGNFQGVFKIQVDAANETAEELGRIVHEVSTVLNNMASGDFSLSSVPEFRGEFSQISKSLNQILNVLNQVFGDIHATAEQVAAGASEVSDGSQSLSQGATEQASAVQELTATISEIASQTKNNAENANQAKELVGRVQASALQGGERMKNMLESMDQISESSQNISKIIKVIDEIAFQTNILALNAAVEAARAGQYGKGFAVVAEEVRNLAARSANAAKETTALIENTVEKVQIGTTTANDTAKKFEDISQGVQKMTELVEGISSASNEQASGISQVDTGVEQVSQVVQTNSATSEQSAAASEELSGQAEELRNKLLQFKLR